MRQSAAYLNGLAEIQDAQSQAVTLALKLQAGTTALDYCAGGGGKALALAAHGVKVTAHDANPARMQDLDARAARAGTPIAQSLSVDQSSQFDCVLLDVPCSGSGAWRRQPDAKWRLTPDRLKELVAIQRQILTKCRAFVRPGGQLAYVTCSLLQCENEYQAAWFQGQTGWDTGVQRRWWPGQNGDGFFLATFFRPN